MSFSDIVILFNRFEAGFWLALALGVLVLLRHCSTRTGRWGLFIALIAFGLSDLAETDGWWRPWWLLAWKSAALLCIILCTILVRRYSNILKNVRMSPEGDTAGTFGGGSRPFAPEPNDD